MRREQPFALARCRAGSRAARARRSVATASASRVAQREVREAREPGSKPCTTSKRAAREREREVRAHADGDADPAAARDRDGRPERDHVRARLRSAERAAARRRGRAARLDGARTVTACPSARSSAATPATCSFTSCGCDHANGVTRQIRRATSSSGAPGRSRVGTCGCGPQERSGARSWRPRFGRSRERATTRAGSARSPRRRRRVRPCLPLLRVKEEGARERSSARPGHRCSRANGEVERGRFGARAGPKATALLSARGVATPSRPGS